MSDEQILDELFAEPIEADGLLADSLIRDPNDKGEPEPDADAERAERLARARDLLWGRYP